MLLADKKRKLKANQSERDCGSNAISGSRLLFRARMAERMLSSYDVTGWEDELSQPKRKPWRSMPLLPTSSGGPIIVCLDTSYSMTGPRERLAKAGESSW